MSLCFADWGWLCRVEWFLLIAPSVSKVNNVLQSQSSQPLMGSARQRKSNGKKINPSDALKMIRFSTVVKVFVYLCILFPFCGCYFKKYYSKIFCEILQICRGIDFLNLNWNKSKRGQSQEQEFLNRWDTLNNNSLFRIDYSLWISNQNVLYWELTVITTL